MPLKFHPNPNLDITTDEAIEAVSDPVIEAANRSNQRGGRMLSVIDLLEAETLTLSQTAWLLARIEEGASWMVGAKPGGAGKTAVMSALLTMLPAGEKIRLTNPGTGWERAAPGECVVAYELSPGAYDAYIWGDDVRRLAHLAATGRRIVTNLHADTLEEARRQIVSECGAAPEDFAAFDIFIPISLRREAGAYSSRRRVEEIFYSESDSQWRALETQSDPPPREKSIANFLMDCRQSALRRIEQVRPAWLKWRAQYPFAL
ncbi:MAG: hypothetical protein NTX50_08005 [Candidatus Sumerlaeota bacterium]|nr:hypothetical protein [Candidatus Sumerlaeota bacterium]